MNKKGLLLLVITLILGMLVFAACAGAAPQSADEAAAVEEPASGEAAAEATEEPAEEEAAAEEEAPADEAAETEASLTIWADESRAAILSALAEDFEASYGVALIVEQVADIRDQFVIAAPAGEGPDIIVGAHDWLGQLVDSGLLAPVDLGEKADSFTPLALEGFTYNGELYGMPQATENMGFFYNTDLVPEPPTTWEEVAAIGAELQASGDASYALALTGTTYDAFPIQTAFGGYIFGQDADGNYDPSDVGIDSEGMIDAGEWLAAQIEAGVIADNTDWDTGHVLFETGETPFLMAGPWALDRLRESGVPYAVANFPDGGKPFAGVQGFMINALSENELLAEAFLTEFVATPEIMQEIYDATNRASAFVEVLEATEDADLAALAEAGVDASLMPAIPEMATVWSSWGDAFALIINGEENPEAALTNAATQIRDLIAAE